MRLLARKLSLTFSSPAASFGVRRTSGGRVAEDGMREGSREEVRGCVMSVSWCARTREGPPTGGGSLPVFAIERSVVGVERG
jgi:hypothetical protein